LQAHYDCKKIVPFLAKHFCVSNWTAHQIFGKFD
jgi:hypothetical protein